MNWKKWLGIILGIVVIGGLIWFFIPNNDESTSAISVETANVELGNLQETIETSGQIESVDSQEVFNQGPVLSVDASLGDEVSEGDTLAEYAESGEVTASMDGTVTEVNIEEGAMDSNLQQGQPSIVVQDLNNLQVGIQVSKADADQIQTDQPVELTYNDRTYEGTVQEIAPVATEDQAGSLAMGGGGEASPTLDVIISFEEQPEDIIAGFDIDASIIVETSEDTPTIPIEALTYDADGNPAVYVVNNGTAQLTDITLGIHADTEVEVTEGVSEGDTVILSPSEELEDGSTVETNQEAQE